MENDWLAQYQFKVTGWGIVFICGMVLRCAGTIKSVPVTADLTTTVIHSAKLLINAVKPANSLMHSNGFQTNVMLYTCMLCLIDNSRTKSQQK